MKHTILKLLLLINYILIILHMSWLTNKGTQLSIESITPMLISSIMLIDSTYIISCNVRKNKILSLFCGLLALDSWYMLLSFETISIAKFAYMILSPVIWYISVKFIFMFLFQDSGYKFQQSTNIFLFASCIGSLVGVAISDKAFACMYGIQFLVYLLCFLLVMGYHWKRVVFVLRSECKSILVSIVIVVVFFTIYYFATLGITNHIGNFGIYLTLAVFFISIHSIILKEQNSFPLSTIFSIKQNIFIVFLFAFVLGLINLFIGGGYEEPIISINTLFVFIFICNIILEQNLSNNKSEIIKQNKYNAALWQLQQEELLKTEFANFLHDNILQDLLSVKNMMSKANRPEIQDIIIETLDRLNIYIRKQMQDYHPIILKNLTAKENYQNLVEGVSQTFPHRNINISFECSNNLFLVEPYNLLVYRLLKELITNVYKHSDSDQAWIVLTQKSGIIELKVSDEGTTDISCLLASDTKKHKGIASIDEQVKRINGTIIYANNIPYGISIHITIPMKGDVSYQHFVS